MINGMEITVLDLTSAHRSSKLLPTVKGVKCFSGLTVVLYW